MIRWIVGGPGRIVIIQLKDPRTKHPGVFFRSCMEKRKIEKRVENSENFILTPEQYKKLMDAKIQRIKHYQRLDKRLETVLKYGL